MLAPIISNNYTGFATTSCAWPTSPNKEPIALSLPFSRPARAEQIASSGRATMDGLFELIVLPSQQIAKTDSWLRCKEDGTVVGPNEAKNRHRALIIGQIAHKLVARGELEQREGKNSHSVLTRHEETLSNRRCELWRQVVDLVSESKDGDGEGD